MTDKIPPPIPPLPDYIFDRPPGVAFKNRFYRLSRLTLKGRKQAWRARCHPKKKGHNLSYVPAIRISPWELAAHLPIISALLAT